jgi:hypothetical protein
MSLVQTGDHDIECKLAEPTITADTIPNFTVTTNGSPAFASIRIRSVAAAKMSPARVPKLAAVLGDVEIAVVERIPLVAAELVNRPGGG